MIRGPSSGAITGHGRIGADDPRFPEPVRWELDMLDAADLVVMYLAPGTRSPVSLLELGLCTLDDLIADLGQLLRSQP